MYMHLICVYNRRWSPHLKLIPGISIILTTAKKKLLCPKTHTQIQTHSIPRLIRLFREHVFLGRCLSTRLGFLEAMDWSAKHPLGFENSSTSERMFNGWSSKIPTVCMQGKFALSSATRERHKQVQTPPLRYKIYPNGGRWQPMNGENRPLLWEITGCKFETSGKIVHHFIRTQRTCLESMKERRKMSTCNRLDLDTLGCQPIMSQTFLGILMKQWNGEKFEPPRSLSLLLLLSTGYLLKCSGCS